ncbi:MAG TPA: helix-turn-helix transcriptional regulator [Sedimentisphaerales bacterium]
MSVQVIERNGQPEWAILPYEEYLQLVEQAETLQDIQDYDRIKAAVESGEEEVIPAGVAFTLAVGESPVKVWREYRQLTQQQLAELVGMSVPFLSRIETAKRKTSMKTMVAIAKALRVTVDDLITSG